jgi:hypothetical protein
MQGPGPAQPIACDATAGSALAVAASPGAEKLSASWSTVEPSRTHLSGAMKEGPSDRKPRL